MVVAADQLVLVVLVALVVLNAIMVMMVVMVDGLAQAVLVAPL